MRRTETPKPIWIKCCTVVDIPDVVTYTNFGDHRLRGFWVAGGQISSSPIDFHRRPYNTLALPCERVIFSIHSFPIADWQCSIYLSIPSFPSFSLPSFLPLFLLSLPCLPLFSLRLPPFAPLMCLLSTSTLREFLPLRFRPLSPPSSPFRPP